MMNYWFINLNAPDFPKKIQRCIFVLIMFLVLKTWYNYHISDAHVSSSDAGAAENTSMTLTELSVFMKKQELELQLRTEKEREEGECGLC